MKSKIELLLDCIIKHFLLYNDSAYEHLGFVEPNVNKSQIDNNVNVTNSNKTEYDKQFFYVSESLKLLYSEQTFRTSARFEPYLKRKCTRRIDETQSAPENYKNSDTDDNNTQHRSRRESLKALKSNQRGRRVSFVDISGAALSTVCILPDDRGKGTKNRFSSSVGTFNQPESLINGKPFSTREKQTKNLRIGSTLPINNELAMRRRLVRNGVCLEWVKVNGRDVTGTIRVRRDVGKTTVKVHCSTNHTHFYTHIRAHRSDKPTEHEAYAELRSSEAEPSDSDLDLLEVFSRFIFSLNFPSDCDHIEFAISSTPRNSDKVFWDDNGGQYYHIYTHQGYVNSTGSDLSLTNNRPTCLKDNHHLSRYVHENRNRLHHTHDRKLSSKKISLKSQSAQPRYLGEKKTRRKKLSGKDRLKIPSLIYL